MWDYVELFYREQGQEGSGYATPSYLQGLASQIPGLNVTQWNTGRTSPALSSEVSADKNAAFAAGLNSTPSLVVTGQRGARALVGDATAGDIAQAIQAVR